MFSLQAYFLYSPCNMLAWPANLFLWYIYLLILRQGSKYHCSRRRLVHFVLDQCPLLIPLLEHISLNHEYSLPDYSMNLSWLLPSKKRGKRVCAVISTVVNTRSTYSRNHYRKFKNQKSINQFNFNYRYSKLLVVSTVVSDS